MNLVESAIPFFFALLLLELWATRRRRGYRFGDMLGNLACGVGEQVLVATTSAGLLLYELIQRQGALRVDEGSVWQWVVVFLGVDFCYYWSHRACHRINLMWAAHSVHHQSEDFNLSVALRQSAMQKALSWPFYVPLALLGVPTGMLVTCYSINLIYQFWIHTPLIKKLGPVEWIFNTPSHHRVHHGADDEYLDKNHGGVLIVWDRLFGTFAEEVRWPRFGTVKPLHGFSAVTAHVEPWRLLWRKAKTATRLRDKVRTWFAPPEWSPPGAPPEPGPLRTDADYALHDPRYDRADVVRALLVFAPTLGLALYFLRAAPALEPLPRAGIAVAVVLGLAALGFVLDRARRPAAVPLLRPGE